MGGKDETELERELTKLYYSENGKLIYYRCGMLVLMIGYVFTLASKLKLQLNNEISTSYALLLVSIGLYVVSLGLGLYGLKYRVSNFANSLGLINERKQYLTKFSDVKFINDLVISVAKSNADDESLYNKLHIWVMNLGCLIMFIWLFVE